MNDVPIDMKPEGRSMADEGARHAFHAPAIDDAGGHMHQEIETDRVAVRAEEAVQ